MEAPVAKWFLHHHKELDDYKIQKTIEEETGSSVGISTKNPDIIKMIELFTSSSHAYEVSGLDEHLLVFGYSVLLKLSIQF